MALHLACIGAVGLLALACVLGVGDPGGGQARAGDEEDFVLIKPASMKWRPAPPSLPHGAQLAPLSGDPKKAGAPFTARIKMPAGYKVPPHWHPVDEAVTVIQGTLLLGRGEKFDLETAEELPAGSFTLLPKGMRRFFAAKDETIIQVHGLGPLQINYVNAADDPHPKK